MLSSTYAHTGTFTTKTLADLNVERRLNYLLYQQLCSDLGDAINPLQRPCMHQTNAMDGQESLPALAKKA